MSERAGQSRVIIRNLISAHLRFTRRARGFSIFVTQAAYKVYICDTESDIVLRTTPQRGKVHE